jgi:hypothetical protein
LPEVRHGEYGPWLRDQDEVEPRWQFGLAESKRFPEQSLDPPATHRVAVLAADAQPDSRRSRRIRGCKYQQQLIAGPATECVHALEVGRTRNPLAFAKS